MKTIILLLINLTIITGWLQAQEEPATSEKEKPDKPERAAFEDQWLINNPTNVVNTKGTFEFSIQHRFGTFNGGNNDLIGIWAPSNIRLGFSYSIHDRATLGFGTTKDNRLQDFNLKAAIFRQTRSGSIPVSVSYYGEMAIDSRDGSNFLNSSDRFSYFHSLIVARRFTRQVSFQVIPSLSHYNIVAPGLSNDVFSLAAGGRVKLSGQVAIIADYSQPITQGSDNPGVSLGIEMSTGLHVFQIFVGNYNGIVPQKNYMFNINDVSNGDFLIGFNITRKWNF